MATDAPESGPVWFHGDAIVVVVFTGHVDADSVAALTTTLEAAVAGRALRGAIFDTLGVTGVNPNVTKTGNALLEVLKRRGVTRSVAAATSGAVRMFGSAIALAAGLRLKFVETMPQAKEEIVSMLAKETR